MKGRRADVALVEQGLFESRAKAAAAIACGLVTADGAQVVKASQSLRLGAVLTASPAYPWVSRGGLKLAAALDGFGLDPRGKFCLDIGASTGGFTDVLLSRGARYVVAVDVGHGQVHERLRFDPRVAVLEGCDARGLTMRDVGAPFDMVVCDVSFISLRLVLPSVLRLARPDAVMVALIKPQFEAGPRRVKKGIVRDAAIHAAVCRDVEALVVDLGWQTLGLLPSPIEGGDGNREFLLGARHADG